MRHTGGVNATVDAGGCHCNPTAAHEQQACGSEDKTLAADHGKITSSDGGAHGVSARWVRGGETFWAASPVLADRSSGVAPDTGFIAPVMVVLLVCPGNTIGGTAVNGYRDDGLATWPTAVAIHDGLGKCYREHGYHVLITTDNRVELQRDFHGPTTRLQNGRLIRIKSTELRIDPSSPSPSQSWRI